MCRCGRASLVIKYETTRGAMRSCSVCPHCDLMTHWPRWGTLKLRVKKDVAGSQ